MSRRPSITRRDFLNGVAFTAAASFSAFPARGLIAEVNVTDSNTPYPPGLTGMRGNHPGSFDAAHALAWANETPEKKVIDTGEEYDLVIVGGGISGLAAACFFQQKRGRDQRILILENHDDFGGHAKRNEFESDGRMLLGIGGAVNLESPEKYGPIIRDLFDSIGLDLKNLEDSMEPHSYLSSMNTPTGMFLENATGQNKMVIGRWLRAFGGIGDYVSLINQLPLPESERSKIIQLASGDTDYLSGLSIGERAQYLSSTPYHEFLQDKVGLDHLTLPLFEALIRLLTGVGGDGLSANEAFQYGAPGMKSVGWPWKPAEKVLIDEDDAPYHALLFPDGNSSVARLMVRHLIPAVSPGNHNGIDDLVGARFKYDQLDSSDAPVRLRLNSTAIGARQQGDEVKVTYVEHGEPKQVRANHCILACFNSIIPRLCPELPEEQREALKYGVKVPFHWANVVLRVGAPFYEAGAEFFECPDSYFSVVTKSPATTFRDFRPPQGPGEPLVLFMMRSPTPGKEPDLSARDLFRQVRYEMLETPFSTYEGEIRRQLTAMFSAHGFDAERDIEAITVNRWAHGYAYNYLELDDGPFEDGKYPHEIGRRQFGRISIANSDSEARAFLDGAIESGWRAVKEQNYIRD